MQGRLFTRPFVIVTLANTFAGIAWALSIHFPRFLESIGADEFAIGLIFAAAAVASIAVKPLVGRFIDQRGRRPMILLGTVIQTIAVALYFTIESVDAWAYVVRTLHGMSIGLWFTALTTYAADVVPVERRTQGLALFGVSGMLSIAFGGLIGDIVIEARGFDGFFTAWLAFAVLALGLSVTLKDVPQEIHAEPASGFVASLRHGRLAPIWFISFVFAMGLAAYFTFMATFVTEVGFGNVSSFFAAYAITAIVERLAVGWLPDRIGQKAVLFPSILAMAAGLFLLSGASAGNWVLAAGALCGAGHGFVFPILYAMTVERASTADRGSAVAIFTMLFDGGGLVAGPAWGLVITTLGYTAMWATVGVFVISGLVLFSVWDREHQPVRARSMASAA